MSYKNLLKKLEERTDFMMLSEEEEDKVMIRCPIGHEFYEKIQILEKQLVCPLCSKMNDDEKRIFRIIPFPFHRRKTARELWIQCITLVMITYLKGN
jgi:hypothetical protein